MVEITEQEFIDNLDSDDFFRRLVILSNLMQMEDT